MRTTVRLTLAVGLALAAFSSPLFANDDSDWSTDRLDDAWAERALADPELDQGWNQSCRNNDWNDHRVSHCAVREFSYPRAKGPVEIDGGDNSGMTVMGSNRDGVRVLYRVIARARTEERARALTADVKLELVKGWLQPNGPPVSSRDDWWSVDVKVWVPRASDLALRTHNGPLGVRDVHGRMELSSINGPMSLVDLGGAIEARVQNGPLHVALAGSRWEGAGLDAEAQNGPLNLVLPARYSAHIVTGTINGPESLDYALQVNRRTSWINAKLGNGGPPVRVVTHNGPFHIGER